MLAAVFMTENIFIALAILIYFFKDKTKYIIEFEFLGFLWGIFFKLSTNVKKTIVYITI